MVSHTPAAPDFELRHGLAALEVEERLDAGRRTEDVGARVVSFYLADMQERGLHQELGFPSTERFADGRLGMAASTTRERVATSRALAELPALDRAFREGRLRWSAVRELARVATAETDEAWARWAEGRTVRDVSRQCKQRERGQLPTDSERRRIHTPKVAVQAKLDPVQREAWETARAKLEAEMGGPLSDTEVLLEAARLVLETRPDGSVPGRTPSGERCFRVDVRTCEECETSRLSTGEGEVEIAPIEGHVNAGPANPDEQRDVETPEAMRKRVLARDGHRCLACGSKKGLCVHHVHWRSRGGATALENLVSLCEECHSLVHAWLLVVEGTVPDGLYFRDRLARELPGWRGRGDARASQGGTQTKRNGSAVSALPTVGPAPAGDARASRLELGALPAEVDADWWARHRHCFSWHQGQGALVLDPDPTAPPKGTADARASRARTPEGPSLDALVGQDRVVGVLSDTARAAREAGEALPHVLLTGPPGLGKTTLATAYAGEGGARLWRTSATTVQEPGALVILLTSLEEGDVLFLDELHGLPQAVAELLYEALAEGTLSLPVGHGLERRTLRVRLAPWTLVAATTEEHRLPEPLRGRFTVQERLELYGEDELVEIVRRAADRDGLPVQPAAAARIARAARETPREALRLYDAVRTTVRLEDTTEIDEDQVARTLERHGIDERGLRPMDRTYLQVLEEAGRPLSLRTLAGRLAAPSGVLERVVEPVLLRKGLIRMTPHGRVVV